MQNITESKIGGNTEGKQEKHPMKRQKHLWKHAETPWETVGNGKETGTNSIEGITIILTGI